MRRTENVRCRGRPETPGAPASLRDAGLVWNEHRWLPTIPPSDHPPSKPVAWPRGRHGECLPSTGSPGSGSRPSPMAKLSGPHLGAARETTRGVQVAPACGLVPAQEGRLIASVDSVRKRRLEAPPDVSVTRLFMNSRRERTISAPSRSGDSSHASQPQWGYVTCRQRPYRMTTPGNRVNPIPRGPLPAGGVRRTTSVTKRPRG